MAFTAFLMTYIVALTHAPVMVLLPLMVPGFIAFFFLPYIAAQLLGVVMDAAERTFESDRLQDCLFATAVCLLAMGPWFAFVWTTIRPF